MKRYSLLVIALLLACESPTPPPEWPAAGPAALASTAAACPDPSTVLLTDLPIA